MADTLGDFKDLVREALKRGTSLDTYIPSRIAQAARWIERNKTYQYMRRWVSLGPLNPDADNPHIISLYGLRIKSLTALRYYDPNDTSLEEGERRFVDIALIEPKDRTTRKFGPPSGYWLDGVSNIVLDAIPEEAYEFEGHVAQYSAWPTDDSARHWLIENAEDVLLAKTMDLFTPILRDVELKAIYDGQLATGLTTMHNAEEDLQQENKSESMVWEPPWGLSETLEPGQDG